VTDAITPDTVLGYLEDVDYPADKDTLLAAAQRHSAPDEVLKAIRAIPPVDYRSRAEVARSVAVDPGSGRSPSLAAEQARTKAPPGLAEHMRDPRTTG
jgi:hypothetical protein